MSKSIIVEQLFDRGKGSRRRLYGEFVQFSTGQMGYIAIRKHDEIFRGGEKSLSDAMRKGKASWAIDDGTIKLAESRGCRFIGVRVKDTGDLYLTKIENYLDKTKIQFYDYSARGGALQRYLPLAHFKLQPGKVKL